MNFNEIGPTPSYVFCTDTQVNADQLQSKHPKHRRKRLRTDGPTSHSGALNGRVSTQPDFSQLPGVDAAAASTITIQSPNTLHVEESYTVPTKDLSSDFPTNALNHSTPSTDWRRQMAPRPCETQSKYKLTEFTSKDKADLNSVMCGELPPNKLLSNGDTPLMAFTRNKILSDSEKVKPIERLLKLNADPCIANQEGVTPLELSLEHGWMDISIALLSVKPSNLPLKALAAGKWFCQIASDRSSTKLLELACALMTHDKELFQTYSFKIFVAILVHKGFSYSKKEELLKKVLDTKFAGDPPIEFNINTVSTRDNLPGAKKARRTPLGFLIQCDIVKAEKELLIKFLIDKGINPEIKDGHGDDAFVCAHKKWHTYIIKVIETALIERKERETFSQTN